MSPVLLKSYPPEICGLDLPLPAGMFRARELAAAALTESRGTPADLRRQTWPGASLQFPGKTAALSHCSGQDSVRTLLGAALVKLTHSVTLNTRSGAGPGVYAGWRGVLQFPLKSQKPRRVRKTAVGGCIGAMVI